MNEQFALFPDPTRPKQYQPGERPSATPTDTADDAGIEPPEAAQHRVRSDVVQALFGDAPLAASIESGPRPAEYYVPPENQLALFDAPTVYEDEWKGMPEFVQKEQEPYAQIIVRIRNADDLAAFRNLVGQPTIHRGTKDIWYPALRPIRVMGEWAYVDDS